MSPKQPADWSALVNRTLRAADTCMWCIVDVILAIAAATFIKVFYREILGVFILLTMAAGSLIAVLATSMAALVIAATIIRVAGWIVYRYAQLTAIGYQFACHVAKWCITRAADPTNA